MKRIYPYLCPNCDNDYYGPEFAGIPELLVEMTITGFLTHTPTGGAEFMLSPTDDNMCPVWGDNSDTSCAACSFSGPLKCFKSPKESDT